MKGPVIGIALASVAMVAATWWVLQDPGLAEGTRNALVILVGLQLVINISFAAGMLYFDKILKAWREGLEEVE